MSIVKSANIPTEQGHCGLIKKLSTENPARLIHLTVKNAERHYHKNTTEYYYVLKGRGQVFLNGEVFAIEQGDLIQIQPNTLHQAIEGDETLEILVIEVPPAIGDVYYV